LQNLVKNADSYNDRLKRKEDAERLEKLKKLDAQDRQRKRDELGVVRATNSQEDGRERKRRRVEKADEREDDPKSKHQHRGRDKDRHRRRRQRRNTSSGSSRPRSASRSGGRERTKERRKCRSRRNDHASESGNDKEPERHAHQKRTRRSSHIALKTSADPEIDNTTRTSPTENALSGSNQATSKMDAHFSKDYKPNEDVQPNSDEDSDWDKALNAMRDGANFKRIQESRLLAAGFTEEQVKKWKSSDVASLEKGVSDVKWKRKGEEREWDKGKTVLGEDVEFSDNEKVLQVDKSESKRSRPKDSRRQEGWKKSGGLLKGFKSALGK
jgi:hypothetical protein